MNKKRLALLALPAVFTIALATPAHALADDGDQTTLVEPSYDTASPAIQTMMTYVFAQVGKPYVFDAAGPDAFDCSGLTMMAYRQIGIDLPHYSVSQAAMGWAVSRDDIRAGDLLFFYGGHAPVRNKGHVAIAVSPTMMVSAPRPGVPVHEVPIPGNVQSVRRYVD
jgi:cell wall-associated NlpC family hydrolase